MTKDEILKMVNVIPINKNSDNIIFIDNHAMSREDIHRLANCINKNNLNFCCIAVTRGNPHDAVKLVSAEKIETVDESA